MKRTSTYRKSDAVHEPSEINGRMGWACGTVSLKCFMAMNNAFMIRTSHAKNGDNWLRFGQVSNQHGGRARFRVKQWRVRRNFTLIAARMIT